MSATPPGDLLAKPASGARAGRLRAAMALHGMSACGRALTIRSPAAPLVLGWNGCPAAFLPPGLRPAAVRADRCPAPGSQRPGARQTPECRHLAAGHALTALAGLYPLLAGRRSAWRFAAAQSKNPRPATGRKWRDFLRRLLISSLFTSALLLNAAASAGAPQAVPNRPPLQPGAFTPLPLGAVKPLGCLRQQLQIQAAGLSGHLDEFWPSLARDSGWLGGTGESWERGPYYTDGLVPLAYLLEEPALIAKANKWVGWTLDNQHANGWIGPAKNQDWWPNMVMLKALTQYQEATGDARVIPLMERYFRHQLEEMPRRRLERWAIYRWQDEVLSVLWLYNRTGNPKLLDLARLLKQQGFDWQAHFDPFLHCRKLAKSETNLSTHVVNNAMALKAPAVWWLVSGGTAEREALDRQFRELDRCHLLPNGAHSGDEHYAGLDPTQGTELCAIVEGVFSLIHIVGHRWRHLRRPPRKTGLQPVARNLHGGHVGAPIRSAA